MQKNIIKFKTGREPARHTVDMSDHIRLPTYPRCNTNFNTLCVV